MIELQNLNNRSLEDILDESKKQIMYLSTQWTDYQEADPGITLVELFSWLKYVQHEYLSRMTDGVKRKFLDLLDVVMYKNRGSETLVEVSGIDDNVTIPIRTQWKSGSMVFENLNHQTLINSKILNVVFENPEFPSEEEYYKFDGSRAFYLFGRDIDRKNDKNAVRRFTVNFDGPIPSDCIINLYFSVYTSHDLKRNPIKSSEKFEKMADVRWEYYGEESGNTGWHEIELINDSTFNFLFSGIIKMRIKGKMLPINEEYKIRATLVYDEYDYPPRIDGIIPNVFRVCQNYTMCENAIIKKSDIKVDHTFNLFTHTAIYGRSYVYYKKHGGWVRTNLPTFKSDMKNGVLTVDVSEVWNKIKSFGYDDEVFMVVSCSQDIKDKLCLGSGTGMSGQNVKVDAKNVLDSDFEIMISEKIEGEEVFYKWKSVNDFFSSGKYDKHFVLNKDIGFIAFGDHEHGMAPRIGDKNIMLCSLRYTMGESSNTKEGMISSVFSKNKALKNARVRQIVPATGGRDAETLEHAQSRAAELFSRPGRAVTKKDYEDIVKKTPGLMFTNVKVLPDYMPGEDVQKQNCVTIAVRWNRKVGLTLPQSFEKNIMNQINRYRLLNTKIKIVSPEYIGLIISGEIVVDSSYRESDMLIEKKIKSFIKDTNKDLGQTLHFGDLFGMIDRLKYVSYLDKLRITPIGINAEKNASEDIIIPPNGVYYVEKIDFNYIKSSEIYRS